MKVSSEDRLGRLAKLEARIEQGKLAYMDVGKALNEIREHRLYKDVEFKTFAEYCLAKWGFTASAGYDYCKAATVGTTQQNAGLDPPKDVKAALAIAEAPTKGTRAAKAAQKVTRRVAGFDRPPFIELTQPPIIATPIPAELEPGPLEPWRIRKFAHEAIVLGVCEQDKRITDPALRRYICPASKLLRQLLRAIPENTILSQVEAEEPTDEEVAEVLAKLA
jgi:hypothetical protein